MIFIEFGHHAKDPGAVSGKWVERDLNIEIGQLIIDYLINVGAGIAIAHDNPAEDLKTTVARIKRMNAESKEQDISLSIHFNAATPKATGTECFIPHRHTDEENKIAKRISIDTATALGIKNRGVKFSGDSARGGLYIDQLTETNVLWEVCFITNEQDMAAYTKNKNSLASIIANILIEHHKALNGK